MRRATGRAQGAGYGNPQVRTRRPRDRLGPTDGPTRLDGRIRGHALASGRRRRPEILGQVAQRGCHDHGAGKLAQRATALEHPPSVLITIHPERFSAAAHTNGYARAATPVTAAQVWKARVRAARYWTAGK